MKLRCFFILLCAGPVGWAHADIYKYVDAEGRVTYTSTPIKGAKKLKLKPLSTSLSPRTKGSPADFPKVDSRTQKGRDDTRRKILEEEMATEDKLLSEARQRLEEGEASPEVFKGKDGKTYRDVAKYEEKIKPLQEEVTLHELNIQALKTELSKLK
ncbi:MAG: DUF4124 domain-containing protein [Gallionellaceae bacterium]|nr:DUF4124 domain-containing protein [Gallionellaceae bacterium]